MAGRGPTRVQLSVWTRRWRAAVRRAPQVAPPSVSLLTLVFVEAQGSRSHQNLQQDADPAVSPAGVAGPWIVLLFSNLLLRLGGCWNRQPHTLLWHVLSHVQPSLCLTFHCEAPTVCRRQTLGRYRRGLRPPPLKVSRRIPGERVCQELPCAGFMFRSSGGQSGVVELKHLVTVENSLNFVFALPSGFSRKVQTR